MAKKRKKPYSMRYVDFASIGTTLFALFFGISWIETFRVFYETSPWVQSALFLIVTALLFGSGALALLHRILCIMELWHIVSIESIRRQPAAEDALRFSVFIVLGYMVFAGAVLAGTKLNVRVLISLVYGFVLLVGWVFILGRLVVRRIHLDVEVWDEKAWM